MYRTEVFSEHHGGIATCEWTPKHCGNGVTKTYREANAKLIAAAPDLLGELENCADLLKTCFPDAPADSCIGGAIALANAAIAKATSQ